MPSGGGAERAGARGAPRLSALGEARRPDRGPAFRWGSSPDWTRGEPEEFHGAPPCFQSGCRISRPPSNRQALELHHRPDLDRAALRVRDPRGDGDRLVEIPGVNHEIAPELLAGLRERTDRKSVV